MMFQEEEGLVVLTCDSLKSSDGRRRAFDGGGRIRLGRVVACGHHSTWMTQFHETTFRLLDCEVMPEVYSGRFKKSSGINAEKR